MIRGLIKYLAYSRMPKTTFAVAHPRTTAQIARTRRDLKHAYAPRMTAVGAALVALPIGYLIGRLGRKANGAEHPRIRRNRVTEREMALEADPSEILP